MHSEIQILCNPTCYHTWRNTWHSCQDQPNGNPWNVQHFTRMWKQSMRSTEEMQQHLYVEHLLPQWPLCFEQDVPKNHLPQVGILGYYCDMWKHNVAHVRTSLERMCVQIWHVSPCEGSVCCPVSTRETSWVPLYLNDSGQWKVSSWRRRMWLGCGQCKLRAQEGSCDKAGGSARHYGSMKWFGMENDWLCDQHRYVIVRTLRDFSMG